MPQPLERILARTGFRASLAKEYTEGRAPGTQHKDGHLAQPGYYDLPPVRKPEWKWYIPGYFFAGGLSSGAYIVATLADLGGRKEDRRLALAGRLVSLIGLLVAPILLTVDLGRPERFHHMLRVFKPRSVMNQGSWMLLINGLFSGVAIVAQAIESLAPPKVARVLAQPVRIFKGLGIIPAVYLGSYTAVLLAATSVPLWAGNKVLMGPLFFSSAMSSGLAATRLVAQLLGGVSSDTERRIARAETVLIGAELALTVASGLVLRRLARPLAVGRLARIYQVGSLGLGLLSPLLLHLRGTSGGVKATIGAALTLIGGLIMRIAIVEGGKQSADDQLAYFEFTRPER